MRIVNLATILLASLTLNVVWAQPQPRMPTTATSPVVASVNGKPIPLAAFEQALQDQLRAGAQDSPALREAIRRDLVIQAVLAQEAEKAGLDRTPELEQRLAAARSALLAQAWQQQWLNANPPTEAEVQAEYDQIKARTGNKEYQIRQVVLRDETAAKLVMEQIKAGKSLADMAKEYSIEPLGKEEGGLLPWITPAALVQPLGDVVSKARVGQLHPEPVRTANGIHIIQLVAERPFTLPPISELRGQLLQNIAQRKLSAAVQEQVNAAKIELR
jgi:peptidyl-prolyl cis-trans isomerase C